MSEEHSTYTQRIAVLEERTNRLQRENDQIWGVLEPLRTLPQMLQRTNEIVQETRTEIKTLGSDLRTHMKAEEAAPERYRIESEAFFKTIIEEFELRQSKLREQEEEKRKNRELRRLEGWRLWLAIAGSCVGLGGSLLAGGKVLLDLFSR